MSNAGTVDGELHRVYEFHKVSGGKYPNLIRIESKLLSVWLAAFANKEIKIKTWNDLKGYKVIYYRGRKNVEKALGKVLPPAHIVSVTNDKEAFNMLAKGIDYIVISESREGNSAIRNNPEFKNIREIAKFEETLIYAYINRKHKKLAPKIAKTIEDMKKDGTFTKIIDEVNKSYN